MQTEHCIKQLLLEVLSLCYHKYVKRWHFFGVNNVHDAFPFV